MSALIRPYRAEDLESVLACFRHSVRELARRDYSPEQTAAWAPAELDADAWAKRLAAAATFVAEVGESVVGFVRVEPRGHIDLLYVAPGRERRGIGRALLETACEWAWNEGAEQLDSDVSITARALFEACGFIVEREQIVERRGQRLRNFRMTKHAPRKRHS